MERESVEGSGKGDKKRDIHWRLANQEEGVKGGGDFKSVPGPKRKSERKKERHRNGEMWTIERQKKQSREGK